MDDQKKPAVDFNVDGHGFNAAWAKKKTADQFVAEFVNMDHIYPDITDKAEKAAKLKQVHAEIMKEGAPAPEQQNTGFMPAKTAEPAK